MLGYCVPVQRQQPSSVVSEHMPDPLSSALAAFAFAVISMLDPIAITAQVKNLSFHDILNSEIEGGIPSCGTVDHYAPNPSDGRICKLGRLSNIPKTDQYCSFSPSLDLTTSLS